MNNDPLAVNQPAIKIASAWLVALLAKFGITSWGDASAFMGFIASFFAAAYTICLMSEWWWKRFWRPFLEEQGILKRRERRKTDRVVARPAQRGQARPRLLVAVLTFSATGLVALTGYESYTDRAVIPVLGDVPTSGFGSTGPDIKLGDKTTPPKAIARLLRDVSHDEAAIHGCVLAPLSQGEYDASVSLAYNIGPTAFCGSTLVKKFNAHDYAGACAEFSKWDRFKGKPLAGLTARRAQERKTCEAG